MPNRKDVLAELTLRASAGAIRSGLGAMEEQIAVLHDIARHHSGRKAADARKFADRIASNVKDIHDALHELEISLHANR